MHVFKGLRVHGFRFCLCFLVGLWRSVVCRALMSRFFGIAQSLGLDNCLGFRVYSLGFRV